MNELEVLIENAKWEKNNKLKKELLKKIELIFEKEKIDQESKKLNFDNIFDDFDNNIPSNAQRIISLCNDKNRDAFLMALDEISWKVEDCFSNKTHTTETPKKLLDSNEKTTRKISSSRDCYIVSWTSRLYFYVCLRLWFFSLLNKNLTTTTIDHNWWEYPKNILTLILFIYEVINKKSQILSTEEREKIQEIIEWFQNNKNIEIKYKNDIYDTKELLEYCRQKIIEIRIEDLDKQLYDPNIEISTDQKKVNEYIKDFWFWDEFNKTLTKLDKYFNDNDSDNDTLSGMIWTYREFFKKFYIKLARQIAKLNALDNIPENEDSTTEIWCARRYIEKEFWLSKEEYRFFDWYKDMTNEKWSHAMLTTKEYFRLMKNIWTEILLFMLSKFGEYKETKSQ